VSRAKGPAIELTPETTLANSELAEDLEERRRLGIDAFAYLVAFAGEIGELLVVPSAMLAGLAVGASVIWFGAEGGDHAAIAREAIESRRGRSW
jgi:hypothetical protein